MHPSHAYTTATSSGTNKRRASISGLPDQFYSCGIAARIFALPSSQIAWYIMKSMIVIQKLCRLLDLWLGPCGAVSSKPDRRSKQSVVLPWWPPLAAFSGEEAQISWFSVTNICPSRARSRHADSTEVAD